MAVSDFAIVKARIPSMTGLEVFVPRKLVEPPRARAKQIEFMRNYAVSRCNDLVEIVWKEVTNGVSIEIRRAIQKESWLIALPNLIDGVVIQLLDDLVGVLFFGRSKVLVVDTVDRS